MEREKLKGFFLQHYQLLKKKMRVLYSIISRRLGDIYQEEDLIGELFEWMSCNAYLYETEQDIINWRDYKPFVESLRDIASPGIPMEESFFVDGQKYDLFEMVGMADRLTANEVKIIELMTGGHDRQSVCREMGSTREALRKSLCRMRKKIY